MAAGRIILSMYMPARDRNDRLLAGAKLYVYVNGTTTLASIYTTSAMSTPLANPVVANSSGAFADIWAEAGTSAVPVKYTLSVTTSDGASPGNPSVYDDYTPSTVYVAPADAALKANNLSDLASASTARTNLGLGSIATQAASAVAITGGSITGITDLTITDGGTGASTAAAARTNLGLAIGTDVQAYDTDLQAIAALTSAADRVPYATGAGTWSLATLTSFARTLLATASNSAFLTALGQIASSAVDFLGAGTGAVTRTMQAKARDAISVKDFGAVGDGVTNDYAAIAAALAAVDTAGGKGGTVFFPAGSYLSSSKIVIPARVRLVGIGSRGTILNLNHNGVLLEINGIENCGVQGMRLGLGSNAAGVAIDIKTTSASVRACLFDDLEIAGGGIAGQIGIRLVTSSSNIIYANNFTNVDFFTIDKPLIDTNSEGNFWRGCTVENWGYTATSALNCQGLANRYQFRIAGSPASGSVGYTQTGAGNSADLVVDIGASSTALNVSAASMNTVILQRPENLTPIGTVGTQNTVIDRNTLFVDRMVANGLAATIGQFTLTGWGTTAAVSDVVGSDQCVRFTITSAGTGQTALPFIQFDFSKAWGKAPIISSVQRCGGSQNDTGPGRSWFSSAATTILWQIRWGSTPVSGEAYTFTVTVV